MNVVNKLKLLIWKNFLLQRRHKWQTLFEILSPVIFSLFIIVIRCLVVPKHIPEMSHTPFYPTYFNSTGKSMENLTSSNMILAFSPENPLCRNVTQNAMATIANDNFGFLYSFFFDASSLPRPNGYKNAKEMENALIQPYAMNHILVGIQFDDNMANATSWPDDINVTLRFPAIMRNPSVDFAVLSSWRTNLIFPLFPQSGAREPEDKYGGKSPGYSTEMFLGIQHAISQGIIKQKTGKQLNTKIYLQRLPQLSSNEDQLLVALERFVSMILMLGFVYTFVNTVKAVTTEKELQLKETMAIMGLSSWLHWLAWFIKQFSFLLISVIIIVTLFKIPFGSTPSGESYAVFTFTPWSVIFFFMVLFIIVSLTFSFMISVFFSRANTAASVMAVIWFGTFAVFMFTQMIFESVKWQTKLILSVFSNTAISYAFQMIIIREGTSTGLQWNDFFKPISYHDQFQPGHVVLMLLLDSTVYMLIAMYVEKIRPGQYGVPLPWYFPFTKSFWITNKKQDNTHVYVKTEAEADYSDALLKTVHDEEPKNVAIGVNIRNLSKIYKGRKKAVDNVNLRVYENEITVLLGHNGAGKTTTISMLTGVVPPSSGSATINGYDIVTETEQARNSLGICPQHNVLFPDLTVAEHIIFYSRLKGVPKNKLKDEVDHFVKLLDLEEKRDTMSSQLSGGQKRRLSVGCAMCGSSRVVLLDEPTSGLDPAARRSLWDLLQREKRGRTMILTTHFMDEADVLADRIAIMAGGRLQCVGTPYFLKKHYGVGYKLTIVKSDDCVVDDVTGFFKDYVPDITENTSIGSELTYILPNEYVSTFPNLLRELEDKKENLRISSYGLSVTSLEEVFMKAGAEDIVENATKRNNNVTSENDNVIVSLDTQSNDSLEPIENVRGIRLLKNHIKAMFLKLAYNAMRNKLSAFIQFVTPVINIMLSVVISRSWKFLSELPPLTLSLESGFRTTQTIISHSQNLTDWSLDARTMLAYKDYFKSSHRPEMTLTDIGNMDLGKFYLKLSEDNLPRIRYEALVGATFFPKNITAWFSNYGYHDSAISLGLVNDAILRALSPGSSLKFVNHPLPYSIENLVEVMATGSSMGFQFAFNIGFCMAFVTAFVVLFVIKERTSGAKLLQRVSGVRPLIMWGSALVWDWVWLFLVYICIIITLACFQELTLSTPAELGRVLLVLSVFSLAIIPLHYLASFYFDAAATGFSKMCFLNIFTGCMPFLITEVLRIPEVGSPFYAHVFDWVFSPLPIYCMSRSFRDMSVSSFSMLACDGLCNQLKITNCTRHTICNELNLTVCCSK
uniref:ABCA3 n=1 Tax=Samia ricini TaxID=63990 RepID=A0A2H4KC39_SAMRI|nr:ABCA3 [Samia ricini]